MNFHNNLDVIILKSMNTKFLDQIIVYFGKNSEFLIDSTSNSKRSIFGIEYPLPNDANIGN